MKSLEGSTEDRKVFIFTEKSGPTKMRNNRIISLNKTGSKNIRKNNNLSTNQTGMLNLHIPFQR